MTQAPSSGSGFDWTSFASPMGGGGGKTTSSSAASVFGNYSQGGGLSDLMPVVTVAAILGAVIVVGALILKAGGR